MSDTKDEPVNLHQTAVFADDDVQIAPGEPIPADTSKETRAILLKTGFFGTPAKVAS